MTMHKALHPREVTLKDDMSRKEEGRRLTNIEDSVEPSIQWLEDYIEKRGRKVITATRNNNINMRSNGPEITKKQKWEEKQLYGHFQRLINDISLEKMWTWLWKGNFNRETESLLITAQNNAIRNNHIKAIIDKMQQNSRCSLWGDRDEAINRIQQISTERI